MYMLLKIKKVVAVVLELNVNLNHKSIHLVYLGDAVIQIRTTSEI